MYFIYSYYILSYTIGSTNPKVILPFFSNTSLTYSLPFSVLSFKVNLTPPPKSLMLSPSNPSFTSIS